MARLIGFVALIPMLVGDFDVVQRWLAQPWLMVFPLLGSLAVCRRGATGSPGWMASALFVTAFAMLASSFWPWIVPYRLTVEQAAAPTSSLSLLF